MYTPLLIILSELHTSSTGRREIVSQSQTNISATQAKLPLATLLVVGAPSQELRDSSINSSISLVIGRITFVAYFGHPCSARINTAFTQEAITSTALNSRVVDEALLPYTFTPQKCKHEVVMEGSRDQSEMFRRVRLPPCNSVDFRP